MRLTTRMRGDGLWWSLVRSTRDPRPVARGVCGCGDLEACTRAAAAVMAAGRNRAYPVAEPTGGFRWVVTDGEGHPVAESAQVFTTVAACGYALHDVRRSLARDGLDGPGGRAADPSGPAVSGHGGTARSEVTTEGHAAGDSTARR